MSKIDEVTSVCGDVSQWMQRELLLCSFSLGVGFLSGSQLWSWKVEGSIFRNWWSLFSPWAKDDMPIQNLSSYRTLLSFR